MTLVVADCSPIRYLVVIEAIQILPRLYDQVIIPQSVLVELTHAHAPAEVRTWASSLPRWAEVKSATRIELAGLLDAGEAEAIALAKELNARFVLLDERSARRIASNEGLAVAGTVSVLEQAAESGLIDLPKALQKLRSTNFRIDPQYLQHALNRDAARREQLQAQERDRNR
jgi:predicted nucleic acid-binding protein